MGTKTELEQIKHQVDTFTEQNGNYRYFDGVHEAGIEESAKELAAAKEPDVFAAFRFERLHPIRA